MKGLVVDAEWKPRNCYLLNEEEKIKKRALIGSQVWRNPQFEIKDISTPNITNDEILIRVRTCGICGSDTHLYETDQDGYILFSGAVKFPCILGHEYAGEVVEVGKDVYDFKEGDIVTGESIMWCGRCLPCRYGMLNQCENIDLMGLTSDGAFVEFVAIKAKYCWNLNGLKERFSKEDIFKIGALIEPLGCAYNGIFISANGFSPGGYAIIYGTGPIGLGAVLLLKATGTGMIIALDRIDERLDIAKKLGADYTFNVEKTYNLERVLMDVTYGWGADLQIEATGAAIHTIPIMEKLYSKRGKIIHLGRAETSATMDLNKIVSGAHSIIGSRGHSGYGIFPNIIRLLQGGRLDSIQEMVTSVFPFSDIITAFDRSKLRTDGKILIQVS